MESSSAYNFQDRHLGPRKHELDSMLHRVGVSSLKELIDETIPQSIRLSHSLDLPEAESEASFLDELRKTSSLNQLFRSFVGLGYYGCITPSVILRNVFENPGWHTPYTPYQAEVSQGRLEALLNFQTMVQDLTAMEVANASLLDEATAAAEAMTMLYRIRRRRLEGADRFVVASTCFPQTIDVIKGRAEPLGLNVVISSPDEITFNDKTFGLLLQCPDVNGAITNLKSFITRAHDNNVLVAVATDLLSLTLFQPPGEQGADVVVGSAQRFGVPMGYGGPHAAFFATRKENTRQIPGRLIGVSSDTKGRQAYRMALQTREQHIRRERATSNICTAQALLANMAGFYAVYHGPEGLTAIASGIYKLTNYLASNLKNIGFTLRNKYFFDTLHISTGSEEINSKIEKLATDKKINFRHFDSSDIGISLDETTTLEDVLKIISVFKDARGTKKKLTERNGSENFSPPDFIRRTSPFLLHPVFNSYHSELQMIRYLKQLEKKDIGLDTSMIPLGSCTMKLTAATSMKPVTWPEFSSIHPFVPVTQAAGYHEIFKNVSKALGTITGLPVVSLQPNSGAQGEFAGLMVIRAYHEAKGEKRRNVILIPASAHGTNPASAAMAGMEIVVVACDSQGNVDLSDLKNKATEYSRKLNSLMITYPSTHGVFEESIREICEIVHAHGGQVYMDGANMNAQVGLTSPAAIGADVCHINLHKTFSIPHGGGGPGMGPIAVAQHLAPYLPGHSIAKTGGKDAIAAISAAPWGSASIVLVAYGYIRMLGLEGVTEATRIAILNANYIKSRLEKHFDVLYSLPNGRVAHELIFDTRTFRTLVGITEQDVAKRLIDYGFHAPTVSFPVPGTLMVEPTESEPQDELDRFCDAMIQIRTEIQEIIDGSTDKNNNVLKNAPHTATEAVSSKWNHPYSREKAVYPLPFVRDQKYWPPVSRIDDAKGDRQLICACPPIETYSSKSENISDTD